MMDYNQLVNSLALAVPVIGMILKLLGALVVFGQSVVAVLPSKIQLEGQEFWAKVNNNPVLGPLLSAIMAFAVKQKS